MSKFLYILSTSHSGSTLLDLLAGTIPGVFSTGEFTYFSWQIYRNGGMCPLGQDRCTCGAKFSDCKVWGPVVQSLSQEKGFDIFNSPFSFKTATFKNPEYGKSTTGMERIVAACYNRLMPLKATRPATSVLGAFAKESVLNSWMIADTLEKIKSIKYVVDSSKSITRWHLLHSYRPFDTYPIVLMRDLRGVASSALKQKKDPIKAAREWMIYYQNAYYTIRNSHNVSPLFVHYEDLCNRPLLTRNRIARQIGAETSSTLPEIDTRNHHLIAGNPMRYKGPLTIRQDKTWKSSLSDAQLEEIKNLEKQTTSLKQMLEKICG